jgi:hypothetical protein
VGSRCISLKDTCNLQPDHTRKRIIFTNCDAFDFEYRFFVARASEYSYLSVLTEGFAFGTRRCHLCGERGGPRRN